MSTTRQEGKDSMPRTINRRNVIRAGAGAVGATLLATGANPMLSRAAQSTVDIKGASVTYLCTPDVEKSGREAAREFEERYGATVEFSLQPTLQLRDKLLAEYVGQTGAIDVVNISPWWLGDFGPFLEPLTEYVNDPAIVDPEFDFADFDPAVLQAYTTFEGTLVGLPSHADHMMLLYRTDLFEDPNEQAAFSAEYGQELVVPQTWEDFDKVAAFFTRPDQELWGLAVMGKRSHQAGAEWINRFFAHGGQYFQENGEPTIGSAAGTMALQHLVKSGNEFAPPGYLTYDFPEARQAFWEGKAAMIEAWPGTVVVGGQDPAQSKIPGKINGRLMPGGHGCGGGWFFGVSIDSQNKVAAYKWLETLTSKTYTKTAFEVDGRMPGRLSPFQATATDDPLVGYVISTLPAGFAEQFSLAFSTSFPPPNQRPEDSELKNELDRFVSEAMANLKLPQQAIEEAQAAWRTILEREGRI